MHVSVLVSSNCSLACSLVPSAIGAEAASATDSLWRISRYLKTLDICIPCQTQNSVKSAHTDIVQIFLDLSDLQNITSFVHFKYPSTHFLPLVRCDVAVEEVSAW